MTDTCLHGRTEYFHKNKRETYKENLPKIPKVVLDDLGVQDVANLPWFDWTATAYDHNLNTRVHDGDPFFVFVNEPRGRTSLEVFEDRRDETVNVKKRFMVVWSWIDSDRAVKDEYHERHWPRNHGCYEYVRTVLVSGLSKSGAQKKARELQKLINDAKKADHESRTLREFGARCRGKRGWKIGDLVKYDNGGKDCGWLYQIVAETASPSAINGQKTVYSYRISAAFTGFRDLKKPDDEVVTPHRIQLVDLTELCQTFADLRGLIDAYLQQNGAKPLGS